MKTTVKVAFALLALGIVVSPTIVSAQWSSDTTANTPVCRATRNQQNLKICSDGDNGAVITWEDYRSGGHWDIYAQRIDKHGNYKWAVDGVLVSNGSSNANNPIICSDGDGGAYIVWEDKRKQSSHGLDLYAQHLRGSDGAKLYNTNGLAIHDTIKGDQINAQICEDGNGNAFVVWEDNRTTITQNSRPDLYMNKLHSGGKSWGNTGSAVIAHGLRQTDAQIIPDGQGGCFMAWKNTFNGPPTSIWGSRISSNGQVLWGTQGTGLLIHKGSDGRLNAQSPRISRDGTVYFVAFEEEQVDASLHGIDVLVQRYSSNGTPSFTFSAQVTPSASGDQRNAVPISDNAGGVLVAYENFVGGYEIAATRVLNDGSTLKPGQPNNIYPLCNLANNQYAPVGIKTPNGGLFVWNDDRAGVGKTGLYMQAVDTTPVRQLWPAGSSVSSRWGKPVSPYANPRIKNQVVIVPRTDGGAIVAWRDSGGTTTGTDIYAQIIFRDGTLPVELASFNVTKQGSAAVLIDWATAMEADNAGFEIERRHLTNDNSDNVFHTVASYQDIPGLRGFANSSSMRKYSYLDVPGAAGFYEYRVVDIALDGSRTAHEPKTIEVGSFTGLSDWSIEPNHPNPFTDQTSVTFNIAERALVDVEIFDELGRVVATPLRSKVLSAGMNMVSLHGTDLGHRYGTFYVIVTARNVETGELIWKTPKASTIVRLK